MFDLSSPTLASLRAAIAKGYTIRFGRSVKPLADFFAKKPERMTALDSSTKVLKSTSLGYRTLILYMTPSNGSGKQLCPMAALAKCEAGCLYTAGKGALSATHYARLRKTLFYNQYPAEALAMIKREIADAYAQSLAEGWTLLVRLNGTSDERWENTGIIEAFPMVQFYDYTKLHNRKNVPANYDLTYSYSGASNRYMSFLSDALANPALKRIAVVFDKRSTVEALIAQGHKFLGLPLVDGDETDVRHIEPSGVAVALYAKGKARKDLSGFVVR